MGTAHVTKYINHVEDNASKASFIIQKLTSSKEEMRASLPRGTESMPLSELHFCKGLAFTFVRKGGIGLSFEQGHGFVIAKLPGDSAGPENTPSWSWSAPLFIDCYAGGLGLTLGYTEIESVMVLDTEEAVQAFLRTQVALDTDISAAAGSYAAAHLPATAANLTNIKLSDKTFTYSIAKGAMIDVSLTGMGYTLDTNMNTALYGPGVTPQAVLEGGVEPPEGMKALYEVLDHALKSYYAYVHDAGRSARPIEAESVAEKAAEEPAAPVAAAAPVQAVPVVASDLEAAAPEIAPVADEGVAPST